MNLSSLVQPLSLKQQFVIDKSWATLCQQENLQFSEYSFANAFFFRYQHNYTFIDTNPPFIMGNFYHGGRYLIPTEKPIAAHFQMIKNLTNENLSLFPIPEKWLGNLKDLSVDTTASRADSDYLFHSQNFKSLSGIGLSNPRNLLHHFQKTYDIKIVDLTKKESTEALDLLEKWQAQTNLAKEKTDYWPCYEALKNENIFKLFGRVVYANGFMVGFIIWELLNQSTALVQFSKSLHQFKGVTPLLYADFAEHLPASVEWINLEQDLGMSTLRQAKLAYRPDILLIKWRLHIM